METKAGQILDQRYELLSEIGKGGMGLVYRARDLELDRVVAIKVLPKFLAHDKESLLRFRREATLLASLEHPNIVSIFAMGGQEGEAPYLVMELINSGDISEFVSSVESPEKMHAGVQAFIKICHALSFIHEQGIIHRDIKPTNLLVWRGDDCAINAKLIDFGTGRLADVSQSQKLTRTGILVGSPPYMSPEIFTGSKPDQRADIYSLGCVIFEYFTGTQYMDLLEITEILVAHMSADLLSRISAVKLENAAQTEKLRCLLTNCLNPDVNLRYPNAMELAEDLQRLEQNVPLAFKPASASANKAKTQKNRRRQVALVAFFVVPLLAAVSSVVALTIFTPRQSEQQRLQSAANCYLDDLENSASALGFLKTLTVPRIKHIKELAQRYLQLSENLPQGAQWWRRRIYAEMEIGFVDTFTGSPDEAINTFKQLFKELDEYKQKYGESADAAADGVPAEKEIVGAKIAFAANCWRTQKDLLLAKKYCEAAAHYKFSLQAGDTTEQWKQRWFRHWSFALLGLISHAVGDTENEEWARARLARFSREGHVPALDGDTISGDVDSILKDADRRLRAKTPWWANRDQ